MAFSKAYKSLSPRMLTTGHNWPLSIIKFMLEIRNSVTAIIFRILYDINSINLNNLSFRNINYDNQY